MDSQVSYTHYESAPHLYRNQPSQNIVYSQQGHASKMPPPPLITQNLDMYPLGDLQAVNAQQMPVLTPLSASVPPTASASPSSSASPFYGSFSDISLGNTSPFPPDSASPAQPISDMNSLGLIHSHQGPNNSAPDTLLRLREEIDSRSEETKALLQEIEQAQDGDQDQDQDQDQDLDSNDPNDVGSGNRAGLKPRGARRRIWTHALEKYLFTPHEIATLGAPHRRTIYLASLEAHIDRLHSQLLNIGLYPIDTNELLQYKGLNCKTAKGMVAGLQHDIASVRMRILEIERANRKAEETAAQGRDQSSAGMSNYNHNHDASTHQQHHHLVHPIGHGEAEQSHFPTSRKFSLDSSMPPPSFPR